MSKVGFQKFEQPSVNSVPLPESLFQMPEYFVLRARQDKLFAGYGWCADELLATLKDLQLYATNGRGGKSLPVTLCARRDGQELDTRLYDTDVNPASLAFRELFYELSDTRPLIDERTRDHPFGRVISRAYCDGLVFYAVETHIEDEKGPYMIIDVRTQLPTDIRAQGARQLSEQERRAMEYEAAHDINALLSGKYDLSDLDPAAG